MCLNCNNYFFFLLGIFLKFGFCIVMICLRKGSLLVSGSYNGLYICYLIGE